MQPLGHQIPLSLYVEIRYMPFLKSIELVALKGWNLIWLESEPSLALAYLTNTRFRPPSYLHIRWLNYLSLIHRKHFTCSHI